jgi:hypothetical protein
MWRRDELDLGLRQALPQSEAITWWRHLEARLDRAADVNGSLITPPPGSVAGATGPRPGAEARGRGAAALHEPRRRPAPPPAWMDASGAPPAEIANQLGHADVNTTAGYLGRRQAPTRAATVTTLGPERPSLAVV